MSDMSGSFVDASWRERDHRHPRMMLARIEGGRMRGQDIVIRNISKRGLGAATQGIFPFVGENLTVKLPTGPTISGAVRWTDGPSFGLLLDIEMDPDSLAAMKRKLQVHAAETKWEVSRLHRVITPIVEQSKLRRV